jgi:hypothetical protein
MDQLRLKNIYVSQKSRREVGRPRLSWLQDVKSDDDLRQLKLRWNQKTNIREEWSVSVVKEQPHTPSNKYNWTPLL